MTEAPINPNMLVLARESRGLTQLELAISLGLKQGTLSKVEAGITEPSEELVGAYSKHLNYPRSFFYQPGALHGTGTEAFHQMYRRRQALPSKAFKKVEAAVNITRLHCQKLLSAVEWEPGVGIPSLSVEAFDGDVEKIAQMIRASWLLPSGPVSNLISAIEDAGGYIIPFDFGTDLVDATSFRFSNLPPLFFYNRNLKGDRLRFTLAHELGHMVMHAVPGAEMEKEADRFAAEFLMPARDITPVLTRFDLRRAAQLKPVWKVSMSALMYRAKTLGKITDVQYRNMVVRKNAAGYRVDEPIGLDVPVEQPRFHREIVQMHLSTLGYTIDQLAKRLDSSIEDIAHLHGLQQPSTTPPGLRLVGRKVA